MNDKSFISQKCKATNEKKKLGRKINGDLYTATSTGKKKKKEKEMERHKIRTGHGSLSAFRRHH